MMRVLLVSDLISDGAILQAGSVVEREAAFCEQLVARGIAVHEAADAPEAPGSLDLEPAPEAAEPRRSPRPSRHR